MLRSVFRLRGVHLYRYVQGEATDVNLIILKGSVFIRHGVFNILEQCAIGQEVHSSILLSETLHVFHRLVHPLGELNLIVNRGDKVKIGEEGDENCLIELALVMGKQALLKELSADC